jgi:hypothetical protein
MVHYIRMVGLQLGEMCETETDRARRSRMATTAREGDIVRRLKNLLQLYK